MTGGTVVVLGPVGANFGAGMTGGRAYLYDPSGRHAAALDVRSVGAVRLSTIVAERPDGPARLTELVRLLEAHRAVGSSLAGRLLDAVDLAADVWLVEPIPTEPAAVEATARPSGADARRIDHAPQPDRNPAVPDPLPTGSSGGVTVDPTWGSVTPG